MKCFVFKPKRRKNGKVSTGRFYSGRYRLKGDSKPTDVPLQTTDKQVAKARLDRIVQELEREREGMIAPKSIRVGAQKPLVDQMKEHLAERLRLGRKEQYVNGLRAHILTLLKECGWQVAKDVTPESFRAWRQRQKKSVKTLNEYLAAISSLLNWMERAERIPKNPLHCVEKIENHGEPTFQRRALTIEEARRLIAVAGPRRATYLTALETGLRRGELGKLEWRDVQLDGPNPFLNVRRSTTKNHKSAPTPIDAELAAELRSIRPENMDPKQRVFAGRIPRMKRFRLDLKAAKIEALDAAGGRVDFHALRMSFQMNLTLSGTTPRVAMELMRHSDMKLTMKTYTDSGLLPTAAAIQNLPSLVNGPYANTPAQKPEYTPLDTPVLGPEGHSASPHGTTEKNGDGPGTLINTGFRHDVAQNVLPCPKWEMVGATGFESSPAFVGDDWRSSQMPMDAWFPGDAGNR